MQLEKTNEGNTSNYLDLTISIVDGRFIYHSYDKRKSFSFEVVNYPYMNSNVPKSPSYGVFISQLTRFCVVNSQVNQFQSNIKELTDKLLRQGFDITIMKAKYRKFYAANIIRWSKFGVDIEDNF